jgi:hypothetical protein
MNISFKGFSFYDFTGNDFFTYIYQDGKEIGSFSDTFGLRLEDKTKPSEELKNECNNLLKEYQTILKQRKNEHTFELSSVKIFERMSQETNCFHSKLKVDNKIIGQCENQGHGGCTNVYSDNEKTNNSLNEIEKWCKELHVSLDSIVDSLLKIEIEKKQLKKQLKKLEKKMLVGLVVKKPNGEMFFLSWKNTTMLDLTTNQNFYNHVKDVIINYKNIGNKVLNTNLPKELMILT